jgi:hypothetical protein
VEISQILKLIFQTLMPNPGGKYKGKKGAGQGEKQKMKGLLIRASHKTDMNLPPP